MSPGSSGRAVLMGDAVRSALLLAGGRSRRLGADKPFVEIGGRTLLERALSATSSIDDVVLSVRDPAPFEAALAAWGWRPPGTVTEPAEPGSPGSPVAPALVRETRRIRLLPDPEPDPGPLAALAWGLAALEGSLAIVLSVDLPFVTAPLVERLVSALSGAPDADGCVPVIEGREQWLCAAYRARLAGPALERVEDPDSDRSVAGLMRGRPIVLLEESDLAACGDPVALTRDVDTPEDLAWARARVIEEREG